MYAKLRCYVLSIIKPLLKIGWMWMNSDICNADKAGIVYSVCHDKTLHFKKEVIIIKKDSVLICGNMMTDQQSYL